MKTNISKRLDDLERRLDPDTYRWLWPWEPKPADGGPVIVMNWGDGPDPDDADLIVEWGEDDEITARRGAR